MRRSFTRAAFILIAGLSLTGIANAQQTNTYTNGRGDTVTDTRSLQNSVYSNDKSVTTPNGKTFRNDKTDSLNGNGGGVTNDTRTGPNGRFVSRTTTHGYYGNRTTVTGPNGHSRTYFRRR
jgi:hypothetical protein